MASLLERKDNNIAVITMDISQEDFAKSMEKSYQKNKSRFQIPGFRKGKVPFHMVKQYYGEGVFYDDAIDFSVNPAYISAIGEHSLDVVSKPELDILEIGGDKGMKFTLTVTLKPEFVLGQYKGLEVEYHDHAVGESEIQAELDRVLERNSRLVPIEDRAVQDGDTVTIDYEGFHNGIAFEGGKGENHDLKIGSNSFIPGFEEQLVGHSVGEDFPIEVTFPEEYHSEDLKGQTVTFQIKIHGIKIKELPELDDEFAKDVSEFDTLEDYKKDILAKKEEEAKNKAEADFEQAILDAVAEKTEIAIPDCMIEKEVDSLVEDQAMRMKYQGIELEQYLQYIGQTIEQFKDGMRDVASKRVKTQLIIEAVVKAENLEATEEEVSTEMDNLALQYKMSREDIETRIAGNNTFITENIKYKKAVKLLVNESIKTACHHEENCQDDNCQDDSCDCHN